MGELKKNPTPVLHFNLYPSIPMDETLRPLSVERGHIREETSCYASPPESNNCPTFIPSDHQQIKRRQSSTNKGEKRGKECMGKPSGSAKKPFVDPVDSQAPLASKLEGSQQRRRRRREWGGVRRDRNELVERNIASAAANNPRSQAPPPGPSRGHSAEGRNETSITRSEGASSVVRITSRSGIHVKSPSGSTLPPMCSVYARREDIPVENRLAPIRADSEARRLPHIKDLGIWKMGRSQTKYRL